MTTEDKINLLKITEQTVHKKLNYPIFGPLGINGIHRVFSLNKRGFDNGKWFFITGTGLLKVEENFFKTVFNFFKENQSDFHYLAFSNQIKEISKLNYSEDVIVVSKQQLQKIGPVFDNSEALFNKCAQSLAKEGDDKVLHYYVLPYIN